MLAWSIVENCSGHGCATKGGRNSDPGYPHHQSSADITSDWFYKWWEKGPAIRFQVYFKF